MKKFKLASVVRGSVGPHVSTVQLILRGLDIKGEDGQPLKVDGEAGKQTMHAVRTYIEQKKAGGVDLGSPDGWGPLCWASLGWPENVNI